MVSKGDLETWRQKLTAVETLDDIQGKIDALGVVFETNRSDLKRIGDQLDEEFRNTSHLPRVPDWIADVKSIYDACCQDLDDFRGFVKEQRWLVAGDGAAGVAAVAGTAEELARQSTQTSASEEVARHAAAADEAVRQAAAAEEAAETAAREQAAREAAETAAREPAAAVVSEGEAALGERPATEESEEDRASDAAWEGFEALAVAKQDQVLKLAERTIAAAKRTNAAGEGRKHIRPDEEDEETKRMEAFITEQQERDKACTDEINNARSAEEIDVALKAIEEWTSLVEEEAQRLKVVLTPKELGIDAEAKRALKQQQKLHEEMNEEYLRSPKTSEVSDQILQQMKENAHVIAGLRCYKARLFLVTFREMVTRPKAVGAIAEVAADAVTFGVTTPVVALVSSVVKLGVVPVAKKLPRRIKALLTFPWAW